LYRDITLDIITTYNFSSILRAGRLCDFLGIVSRPIRDFAPLVYDRIQPKVTFLDEEETDRKHRVIALHQIALKTMNITLEKEMITLMDKNRSNNHNHRLLSLYQAYADFANTSKLVNEELLELFIDHLGWKRGDNQIYEYNIVLP
jgi:hypothetical protein